MRLLIDAAIIAKLSDEFWADTAIVKVVKCSKEDRLLTEHCKTKRRCKDLEYVSSSEHFIYHVPDDII